MSLLKKSIARNVMVFAVDAADNASGKSGLTLTISSSKDGASFASISPTVTDLGNGWYKLALDTGMTDTLGELALQITAANAIIQPYVHEVVSELPGNLAAATIQAIWDALTSALTTSGSIGKFLVDNITALVGYVDTEVAAIKAKTDNLPANTTTRLDTIDTSLATIAGYVDTEVAAIKAKTDNLPADTSATLATIAGYIDTEVASIKTKTDNLPADTTARLDTIDASIAAKPGYMLKKNTAASGFQFTMYASTDGTPLAGIMDLDIELSQDGSSFVNATNSPVELNNGWYKIDLTAAELNGKKIGFRCTGTGARRTDFELLTQD